MSSKKQLSENPFSKIKNAYDYAKKNGINRKDIRTWDSNYKERMKELAGIIKSVENELNELRKIKSKIK